MKRVICAIVLLVAVACTTWYSTAHLKNHFDDLEKHLKYSAVAFQSRDLAASNDSLDAFESILEENKLFLHLFVRRDVLYTLENANATLRSYMSEDTEEDFYAEYARALVQLQAVQDTLFYNL